MTKKKKGDINVVGKKIKQARTKKKMPLDAMANETGFSIDYLKQIEGGKKIPPVVPCCRSPVPWKSIPLFSCGNRLRRLFRIA